MEIKPIATIHTPFPEKFGVPRQSGLAGIQGKIIFNEEYRNPDAIRGLEGYSHIWLLWHFSQSVREGWSPTVRPPRLGGNTRMGVFATRSPFRPNSIGLSSVELVKIDYTAKDSPVLYVRGADMVDGTPVFDIKPYLSFTDSHPDARCGFAEEKYGYSLEVEIPENHLCKIPPESRDAFYEVLKNDPRPAYQENPERIYKMSYLDFTVSFVVENNLLIVTDIINSEDSYER